MITTKPFNYSYENVTFKASMAYENASTTQRPAVLIAHAFEGCNTLMIEHANMLAKQGYVACAVDLYGDGKVATTLEQCMAYLKPLFDDRALLRGRVNAAYDAIKTLPFVNADQIVAVGFCLGGMCVLDLARSGADVKGVVSVHGVLTPPSNVTTETITAKILALHGYQDPQISADTLTTFYNEMTDANIDWQMHYFGHTKHAFTDPDAATIGPPDMGRVYDPVATKRSWVMIQNFFSDVLTLTSPT